MASVCSWSSDRAGESVSAVSSHGQRILKTAASWESNAGQMPPPGTSHLAAKAVGGI